MKNRVIALSLALVSSVALAQPAARPRAGPKVTARVRPYDAYAK